MIKKIIMISFICAITSNLAFAMPNPASVYCVKQGFKTATLGNGQAVCVFPDNTYCEQWAFFRSECKPGMNHFPTPAVCDPFNKK